MSISLADVPRLRHNFEVAIICALPLEANAIIALFDNHWDDSTHELRPSLSEDKNEYTFGRIGLHDVVVVVLPGVGKKQASSAVAAMHPTFRNIQLSLVVGVCAIAPYTGNGSEILLGDVIISTDVIQSDLGRQYADTFMRKDTLEDNLAGPPQEIRRILKRLELEHHHDQLEKRMRGYIEELQSRKDIYVYPGKDSDHLYVTDYTHMHRISEMCTECKRVDGAPDHACARAKSISCADLGCETSQLIPRNRLYDLTDGECHASVWFGRFASGDQVLKSAPHREKLHDKEKVIGFEMEGSGAWEHFPTIIIKSGCDYADSHKSKMWQNHCAGTAAACTKAFLREWRRKENTKARPGVPVAPDHTQNPHSKTFRPRVPPPRSSNPLFLGRATELATIEERLFPTGHREPGMLREPNIFVIQGLGGNGKSELCLRYSKIHERSYWGIFWIDGSIDKSLISGFEHIAAQLGLAGDDFASIRYNLSTQEQPWLLIIDNADDAELDLSPYLPDQGIGHILITTRNPKLDIFQTESTLRLEGLAKNDALALLFKAAGIEAQEQASLTTSAKDILRVLNFHTLAIIQAGAFVRKTHDLNDYVRIFNEQRKHVLKYYTPQAKSQYGSVYTTFEVSASKLHQDAEERHQRSAADALDLLRLFAFMDLQGPFERIFSDARDFATACTVSVGPTPNTDDAPSVSDIEGLTRKHSALLSPLAYSANDHDGKFRWREACDKLYQFSMLSFEKDETGEEVLRLHPLILAWALARQSKNDYRQSWLSVATTIFLSSRGVPEHGPILQQLGAHARACASHVSKDWWTETSNLPFLFLLHHLAWMLLLNRDDIINSDICKCLAVGLETLREEDLELLCDRVSVLYLLGRQAYNIGDIGKSIQVLEEVVKIREQTLAETHPNRLASQHALAAAYESNGQILKAVQLLEHVVKVEEQTLADTHPNRLASQHTLAVVYESNGQILKAVQLLEHVVKIRERTLAETHPNRLASQHALAAAYESNGQILKAVQLLEHVVKVEEQTLADTHPDRLASQHALAGVYRSNGQISEAAQLLEHVVKVQERTLAETHPNRLASQHALAGVYRSNGQISEAAQLLEHVVKVQERTLAETHPDRLASQHALAGVYRSNGQILEAAQLLEHVVKIREQTLAETYPDRLASQHALAAAYESNGQILEAVQLLEHVVKVQERTLAETHPDRLASQHALAGVYESNGQILEAAQLLEHVVKVQERTLAKTHPDRLASQHALAGVYRSNGQILEAAQLLEHVVKVEEQTLADTHPDRLASQHALAAAYESNGQILEAVQLLEHVVKVQERTLAETHPDRLASQHTLAGVYESNGQILEAVQLLEHVVKVQEQTLAETHPYRLASEKFLHSFKQPRADVRS